MNDVLFNAGLVMLGAAVFLAIAHFALYDYRIRPGTLFPDGQEEDDVARTDRDRRVFQAIARTRVTPRDVRLDRFDVHRPQAGTSRKGRE